MTNFPVTTVTWVTPESGQEEKLQVWFEEIAADAALFDGHLGSELYQAIAHYGDKLWLSLFTFDTAAHLDSWMKSEVRANRLAGGVELFGKNIKRQQLAGLEFWFGNANNQQAIPPPRWKMALVSGLIILGLSNTAMSWFSTGFNRLHVPLWITSICSTCLMIILMTWVIMPLVSRVFRGWLIKGLNSN